MAKLTETTVRQLSARKHEPDWMLQLRLQAYQAFRKLPWPDFGPDLSGLDLDQLIYYHADTDQPVDNWNQIPAAIKQIYDQIGLPVAEQHYLAGAQAQHDSAMIYENLRQSLHGQGIIFTDTDTAIQRYPDLVHHYFGTIVRYDTNKLTALNTAVWSGGSFIYIPRGVRVPLPLQAYFRVNIARLGQFERSLIIVDEGAELQYVEGCSAPIFRDNILHDPVVEIAVKPGARMRYTAIQNWSTSVYCLTNECMQVEKDGIGEWIDGNIGSGVVMKYPCIKLVGEGARGDILSLSTATTGQIHDNGGRIVHAAPHTSSTITAKSIATGSGECTYRGQVHVQSGATDARTASRCDTLLINEASRGNTYPTSVIDQPDAQVSHEASTGRLDQAQLFYLMSRGLDEVAATKLIIGGFIEPIMQNLPMEYARELNQLIDLSMEGAVG